MGRDDKDFSKLIGELARILDDNDDDDDDDDDDLFKTVFVLSCVSIIAVYEVMVESILF
jgi:CRISPR/Cas system CSM-associated protein Csm2 small subunit